MVAGWWIPRLALVPKYSGIGRLWDLGAMVRLNPGLVSIPSPDRMAGKRDFLLLVRGRGPRSYGPGVGQSP